jgi:hypothetical protein
MERRRITDRRTFPGGGLRHIDIRPLDGNGYVEMAQQIARLRSVVETIAPAMEKHADAIRALVDAVQALTAGRQKP